MLRTSSPILKPVREKVQAGQRLIKAGNTRRQDTICFLDEVPEYQ